MNILTFASSLYGYLVVSGVLFALGIIGVLSRKNAIGILLGLELILNAASINFVAFSCYKTASIDGQIVSLFIILIAAAEAAVALAIILRLYRLRETVDASDANVMRN